MTCRRMNSRYPGWRTGPKQWKSKPIPNTKYYTSCQIFTSQFTFTGWGLPWTPTAAGWELRRYCDGSQSGILSDARLASCGGAQQRGPVPVRPACRHRHQCVDIHDRRVCDAALHSKTTTCASRIGVLTCRKQILQQSKTKYLTDLQHLCWRTHRAHVSVFFLKSSPQVASFSLLLFLSKVAFG